MRKFNIRVNGVSYEVEVEEIKDGVQSTPTIEAPVQSAPKVTSPVQTQAKPQESPKASTEVPAGATIVEAPMPGNAWKVLVAEGDKVKEGQVLIILEAMKMENEIMSPVDGVVASVNVVQGASVNGGDVLVSIK